MSVWLARTRTTTPSHTTKDFFVKTPLTGLLAGTAVLALGLCALPAQAVPSERLALGGDDARPSRTTVPAR